MLVVLQHSVNHQVEGFSEGFFLLVTHNYRCPHMEVLPNIYRATKEYGQPVPGYLICSINTKESTYGTQQVVSHISHNVFKGMLIEVQIAD